MKKHINLYILIFTCIVSLKMYAQPIPDCKQVIDSLTWIIKAKEYKLARVKFYLNLCDKKPSQKKFEHAWIKRAIK